MATVNDKKQQVRSAAEQDLETFIRLVHPHRVLGAIHCELLRWWTRSDAKSHQLTLLPRDHGKSAMIAYRVAWEITRNPAIRVLYISSTSTLAIKQVKFIKDILTSERYRFYWPEMVHPEESKREKWAETEFCVDHPLRKQESIRDATVFIAGLGKSITGLHCDVAVLDDVVVIENAYTDEGRSKVKSQYSLLSSIETGDAREWIVGTRYHPLDLYHDITEMNVDVYDDQGELVSQEPLYEIFERAVESMGDGSGEFLWPKQQRYDGKWFGFDAQILAKKRAQYLDKTQFRAQYYNDPNDPDSAALSREYFQYYDPKWLRRIEGKWYYKSNRLNVFAAVDFAYSMSKKADYTCVVVVGVDKDRNYYVLEIDRFKSQFIKDYFNSILRLHQKWDFRKIRCEITAAQEIIVKDIKDNYIRVHGLALSVDEFRPNRHEGRKEERIEATLHPRYQNRQIWHYMGGHCQVLEEELVQQNPPHDDIKDALAAAVSVAVAPTSGLLSGAGQKLANALAHKRFGGI